ncbi:hypothetical protein HKX48_006778 [Thoreauomyces humboldtii]|nr:hypothetical protein HKX48_006778 [Thoreauomyces humboldtii]
MQIYFLASMLLAASVLAAPVTVSKRQCNDPSTSAVQNAINTWNNDVNNVNAFLNSIPPVGTQDLVNAAQTALNFAKDEPNNLAVLASICELNSNAVPNYQGAVLSLQHLFPDIPARLQDIVSNPNDGGRVAGNVAAINRDRCCTVLPSIDTLFTTAAPDFGLSGQVPTAVQLPFACSSISC